MTPVVTYQAGNFVWQAAQRRLVQRAVRSQLGQIIDSSVCFIAAELVFLCGSLR